ncbi:MAG TPA: hypothetical protein PKM51_09905 [Chitinophagales bacterium]|jgi:uncharacterized membrane protein|nr:hypothetical protein [Chitinophagales bacterium]
MKLFDYLFYKIYKLINFFGNTDFYPEGNSWFLSSMCLWLNMLAALNFTELRLGRAFINKSYVIILYVLYLTITFIYFFRRERYKKIVENYDEQPQSKKTMGSIIVSIYVIVTLVLHFYFSEHRREMALNM